MNDPTIEVHPLSPFLPPNAVVLMLGSFPPPQSKWRMSFYYPNYQNDMWRIFGLIFFDNSNFFIDVPHKRFKEDEIRYFLAEKGIAIYDTAYKVKRLKANASDQHLEVLENVNIELLLEQIPYCQNLMTTGEKATNTLLDFWGENKHKLGLNHSFQTQTTGRKITLTRLPSSSRAYPLKLEEKAQSYRKYFKNIGLL